MAFLKYVYILAVFFIADSIQTPFLPCGDEPLPLDLRVEGCDKFPCQFPRGSDVIAEWDFGVTADTETLRPVVNVAILGGEVNYPLPEQDACKSLANAECPLDEGEEVTYTLRMPVLELYPRVSFDVKFSLVDQHEKSQVCFKLKAKVV